MGRAYEVRKASIQKTGAARGKIYSMYAKEIYLAAKNGGVEMESNPNLKRLVERAKKEQVPSDIIKRAIDKVNSGADETYQKTIYEMFGPAGSTVMVECLTDNVNRTVSDLRAVVNKTHIKMGAMGSVNYMYDNNCVISLIVNTSLLTSLLFIFTNLSNSLLIKLSTSTALCSALFFLSSFFISYSSSIFILLISSIFSIVSSVNIL